MSEDHETVRKLIEGSLPPEELREDILPGTKDPGRFERVIEILQERVDWDDPILVPLNDHLFAVGTDRGRVVKAACGAELCSLDQNWKKHTHVRVREREEEYEELFPEWMTPHPDWTIQLREFFCPQCMELLDVDAVPAGYPVFQPFRPDVDGFYEEWLDQPPPDRA